MKLQLASYTRSILTAGTIFSLSLFGLILEQSPATAGCYPTGQVVRGMSIVKCSGSTRCRPTGRTRLVNGVRYQILTCPRR
jgi:hypothetical protein